MVNNKVNDKNIMAIVFQLFILFYHFTANSFLLGTGQMILH